MNLDRLLKSFKDGEISIEDVKNTLSPVEDLGFAQLDLHREKRIGFPEVIFGENKTTENLIKILQSLVAKGKRILVTRVDPSKGKSIKKELPEVTYHEIAACVTWQEKDDMKEPYPGYVCVICAGTSDIPVAEEAAVTLELMNSRVVRINDIGVAGIHRLMNKLDDIKKANALIVVAGMEGALPSVIGGLVSKPVIAVPTSVGYGASFNGVAALLGMLNSCAPGIPVMNIDNGFGAGYFVGLINQNMNGAIKNENV